MSTVQRTVMGGRETRLSVCCGIGAASKSVRQSDWGFFIASEHGDSGLRGQKPSPADQRCCDVQVAKATGLYRD